MEDDEDDDTEVEVAEGISAADVEDDAEGGGDDGAGGAGGGGGDAIYSHVLAVYFSLVECLKQIAEKKKNKFG